MKNLPLNLALSTSRRKAMVIQPLSTVSDCHIGWICRIALSDSEKEVGDLMTEESYLSFVSFLESEDSEDNGKEQEGTEDDPPPSTKER
jgi:hypothetical protein